LLDGLFGFFCALQAGGFACGASFLVVVPGTLAFPCCVIGLLALPLCGAAPTFLCRRKEK
jgi:hypothetical protein